MLLCVTCLVATIALIAVDIFVKERDRDLLFHVTQLIRRQYKKPSCPNSGVARPSAPAADQKSAVLSTPQVWLEFKMKEGHVSCLFQGITMNKASWRPQSNTHKLKCVLFFIIDYETCFFCLPLPSSSLLFIFFAFFTYAYTTPTSFIKFSFLLVFSPR